jgi:crotonobetainyl-CoA:carnitine CoA-transferase CaiB-like acyl-CoA transferase
MLLHDPQIEATGFWKVTEHPGEIRRLAPRLGEHSVEVLEEAGFTRAKIDALLASDATASPR